MESELATNGGLCPHAMKPGSPKNTISIATLSWDRRKNCLSYIGGYLSSKAMPPNMFLFLCWVCVCGFVVTLVVEGLEAWG